MKPKRQTPAPPAAPTPPDDELLTVSAASHILNVSTETIRRYHNAGRLPAQRTGGAGARGIYLFRRGDLESLAKERAAGSKRSSG